MSLTLNIEHGIKGSLNTFKMTLIPKLEKAFTYRAVTH